jgi:hypothetical protein
VKHSSFSLSSTQHKSPPSAHTFKISSANVHLHTATLNRPLSVLSEPCQLLISTKLPKPNLPLLLWLPAMALGLDDTVGLILYYFDSNHDPNEVQESLPYAAWRRLCMHAAADFSAAQDIFAAIINKHPAVKSSTGRGMYCAAHQLVAELVLDLQASTVQDIDTAAALWPVLASTASALLINPKGTKQSAHIQLGIKMLKKLFSSCSSFRKYAAGQSRVVGAMGLTMGWRVQHCADFPAISTALKALIEDLLTDSECRAAFLYSTTVVLTDKSAVKTRSPNSSGGLVV